MSKIIGIDPSINNVGWALMDGDTLYAYGTIKSRGETDGEKLSDIRAYIKNNLFYYPQLAILEKPPSFTYTRSQSKWTGRGLNAGAIQKLNMAYGVILELCFSEIEVITPTPQEYKGRISPEQVKANMEALFKKKFNEHEAHAVMMCLWFLKRQKIFSGETVVKNGNRGV